MREVSITRLYRNLSAELMDLPFSITKGGKRVADVTKSLETLEIKPAKSLEVAKNKPTSLEIKPQRIETLGKKTPRQLFKDSHPNELCPTCRYKNKDCQCSVSEDN